MPDTSTFTFVVLASLVLTLIPGPAVLYIVARGVEGGRAAGLASAQGIWVGALVHVAFATAGLSALLASSAAALGVVKWLGVAYLVWLGLSRLFGKDDTATVTATSRRDLAAVFRQGVLVNVLNPKVALFFLAFLPQFVHPEAGPVWLQVLSLGLTASVVGLFTDSIYAMLSGTVAGWLKRRYESARFRRGQRYVSGGIYLALGAAAAATGFGKH